MDEDVPPATRPEEVERVSQALWQQAQGRRVGGLLRDSGIPAVVLKGPEAAAWPARVRKAWYESQGDAERARAAYERTRERSTVESVDDDIGSAAVSTEHPALAHKDKKSAKRENSNLPSGVRTAAPLDE